jgi:hypothetical protein
MNNIDNVFAYMYALGKENKQILLKEFDPNKIDPKKRTQYGRNKITPDRDKFKWLPY